MKKKLLLIFLSVGPILGCANGHYIGPRVDVNAGFMGVSAGVTIWGDPVVKPAASPQPSPIVVSAK